MRELNFDTGVVEYQVNGGSVIRFNPADTRFVEKLHKLFEKLGATQEEIPGEGQVFALMEQKDAAMRQNLDEVFGEGTAHSLFPDVGLYALAGGLPLWANFLLAVLDEVERAMGEQQRLASPRVEKYMAKYAAYQSR